jgi:hypothetical protein
MRKGGLLLVCLALAGCGANASDMEALESYFQKHPDRTIVSDPGAIQSVHCHVRGLMFQGSQVYVCDVHYKWADAEVCGARVNGNIVIRGLPRACIP